METLSIMPIHLGPMTTRALIDGEHRRSDHRILIVDDEPTNRNLCRLVLEAIGLHCDEAANGRLALDALGGAVYDLVVLDIDMPALTGTELLRRLRESPPTPHLKIIMVSGRASADEMARMMSAGADDYLTKPFSARQLQARVQSAERLHAHAAGHCTILPGAPSFFCISRDCDLGLHRRLEFGRDPGFVSDSFGRFQHPMRPYP